MSICWALPVCALAIAGASGCGADGKADAQANRNAPIAIVQETFMTQRDTLLNIDSPAIWHGPAGQHWLLSTAKAGNIVRVEDARTGAFIRDVGGTGPGAGQLARPNGIAVVDNFMIVVERDNARIQVFALPGFQSVGTFGAGELRRPYGVTAYRGADGAYTLYVTDNYDVIDADSLINAPGERVRQYRVLLQDGRAAARLVQTFGETSGEGALRVVESIMADPVQNRLLIAEEMDGASMIQEYTLEGRFTGRTIPPAFFRTQAEGIALYACGLEDGYWIATDQSRVDNTFHVFDRTTLKHRGSFRGPNVLNTDGIALTQRAFGEFPAGAFYAVHDDGNVAAFSWRAIADALGLRHDCLL